VDLEILQQLGVATALGALIGLERERKHHLEHIIDSYAGIRTYALIALAGSLAYTLSVYSMSFFAVVSAGVLLLLIIGYVLGVKKHGGLGMTSEIASVLVYMIGILCGMKLFVVATMVSLLVLTFLLLKAPLHNWAKKIKYEELVSTLEFLIVAFVVLPILPNQSYGPYGFFNPYLIWLLVVFVSGMSFVSYIAIKFFGTRKGLTLTGFFSGFISTTALAFSLSAQSKKNPKVVCPYVLAMIVANFGMLLRVLIEVMVLHFDLAGILLIPILSMATVGGVAGLYLWRKILKGKGKVRGDTSLKLESPFRLVPALKFALLFVTVLLISRFAVQTLGQGGIYLTSFFSGFVDVDAMTVSMANLAHTDLSDSIAVTAIIITVIVNTLVKVGVFFVFGAREVAKGVGLVLVLISVAGLLSLFLI
jgi:uncharacterized membrane protein (DUF4010 family)